jgi:hypothetical protein
LAAAAVADGTLTPAKLAVIAGASCGLHVVSTATANSKVAQIGGALTATLDGTNGKPASYSLINLSRSMSPVYLDAPRGPVTELKPHTVRLYFAEPRGLQPGERVFDVKLQGQTVLNDLDIVKEAGAPDRVLVKEFSGLTLGGDLCVTFVPKTGQPLLCGLEIVREQP